MYRILEKKNPPADSAHPFPEGFAETRKGTVWETFRNYVFFMIDCSPYKCLYSEHMGRGSIPVNVMIGLAVFAQSANMSLKKFCRDLPGNLNVQYAVHADCLKALPSESSVKRFARAVILCHKEKNIDLIRGTVVDLSYRLSEMMSINRNRIRIDTVMVLIYATKLSRYQLIYVCTAGLVRTLVKKGIALPERLGHFTDDADYNYMTYHNTTDSEETKMDVLLGDAVVARDLCVKQGLDNPDLGITEYQLLVRCLNEQTFTGDDGKLHLREKGDKALNSGILQTPVDPDATFRTKRGEAFQGYSLCVTDCSNGHHHLVMDYLLAKNNVGDGEIASALFETHPRQIDRDGVTDVVGDGGFVGEKLAGVLQKLGWNLTNTDLPGRKTADFFADMQFNEGGTELMFCPGGKAPDHFKFYQKTGSVTGWFPKDACAECPLKGQCHPKEQKAFFTRQFSLKQKNRALSQRERGTEEFKELSHFRNGVESDFSVLRRRYRIDEINSHGMYRVAFHIGLMCLVMNVEAFHADLMDREREERKEQGKWNETA